MMKIGIDLNGVLRNTIEKFKQVYQKNLIDNHDDDFENQTFNVDISGNTKENQLEKNFDYKIKSEVDSVNLMNHFTFKNEDELFSFMYEDYTMEIFGHAPSTELNTFNLLNEFYYKFRETNDIIIISEEIGKSKPASLFFLSKFGCLIEELFFYNKITKKNLWNKVDILLTSNPNLLLYKPNGKVLIKFETNYNKQIDSEFKIKSLSELIPTIEIITNVYNF